MVGVSKRIFISIGWSFIKECCDVCFVVVVAIGVAMAIVVMAEMVGFPWSAFKPSADFAVVDASAGSVGTCR